MFTTETLTPEFERTTISALSELHKVNANTVRQE